MLTASMEVDWVSDTLRYPKVCMSTILEYRSAFFDLVFREQPPNLNGSETVVIDRGNKRSRAVTVLAKGCEFILP